MSNKNDNKFASLDSLKAFLDNINLLMDTHNISASSHNDLRTEIEDVSTRLSTLADCDDETLDQISEIVEYVKDNRELIEAITTTKVSVSDLLNLVYPIGSIYMSVTNISPSTFLGGTWEQIKGVFLLSASNTYVAGSTGGSATHKLTAAQMPSVTGKISFHGKYTGNMVSGASGAFSPTSTVSGKYATGTSSTGSNSVEVVGFDNGGQGQAHNNMPPYLTVYMWKRTA